MKDLEKIKSEDLGCQVADANPGNFAIEQEVGAMVGATVPAPTEPSSDDARELGAQLLVFLRRALLPIRSALRTALADIYDHLDSRCTDYTPAAYASYIPRPYDPMRPFVPRTLPNLLTAIIAFADRKISEPNAPDGISLPNLICGNNVTIAEITDSNDGWTLKGAPYGNQGGGSLANLFSAFGSSEKFTLHCKEISGNTHATHSTAKELYMPDIARVDGYFDIRLPNGKVNIPNVEEINLDGGYDGGQSFPMAKEIYMPKLRRIYGYNRLWQYYNPLPMEKIVFGSISQHVGTWEWGSGTADDLLHMEFGADGGAGLQVSTNLSWWTASNVLQNNLDQFLQNFLEHICQRLANRTGQTKLTLTLSADVYTAIMTDNDIKAELVARNWKVTDGTNNYNN